MVVDHFDLVRRRRRGAGEAIAAAAARVSVRRFMDRLLAVAEAVHVAAEDRGPLEEELALVVGRRVR